jgi:hypothetical protein
MHLKPFRFLASSAVSPLHDQHPAESASSRLKNVILQLVQEGLFGIIRGTPWNLFEIQIKIDYHPSSLESVTTPFQHAREDNTIGNKNLGLLPL